MVSRLPAIRRNRIACAAVVAPHKRLLPKTTKIQRISVNFGDAFWIALTVELALLPRRHGGASDYVAKTGLFGGRAGIPTLVRGLGNDSLAITRCDQFGLYSGTFLGIHGGFVAIGRQIVDR